MFRGKASLLSHSCRCFVPAIVQIARAPHQLWEVDAHNYTTESVAEILALRDRLGRSLPGGRSDTLTSKTILGVFGSVPAFDRFVRRGLGVTAFGSKGLKAVADLYEVHAASIEQQRVPTLDFDTGQPTKLRYTRSKVIDMACFIQGGGGRALDRTSPPDDLVGGGAVG